MLTDNCYVIATVPKKARTYCNVFSVVGILISMYGCLVQYMQWDVGHARKLNVHAVKANKNGRNYIMFMGQTHRLKTQHAVFYQFYTSFLIGNFWEIDRKCYRGQNIKTMFSKLLM